MDAEAAGSMEELEVADVVVVVDVVLESGSGQSRP